MKAVQAVYASLLVLSFSVPTFFHTPVSFAAIEEKSPIPESDGLSLKREQLIQVRRANQEKRIADARASKLITAKDARSLRKESRAIMNLRVQAVSDGKISPDEMAKMEKALDELTNHVSAKVQEAEQKKTQ